MYAYNNFCVHLDGVWVIRKIYLIDIVSLYRININDIFIMLKIVNKAIFSTLSSNKILKQGL